MYPHVGVHAGPNITVIDLLRIVDYFLLAVMIASGLLWRDRLD